MSLYHYTSAATHKVALVNICIGKFPSYFPLFMEGVKANPEYTFIIFSDQNEYDGESLPSNLVVKKMAIADLRSLFLSKLGVELIANSPEKLCDYKPAFGLLFEEYLCDYSHWGHCDLTMILGNLSAFITPVLLSKYDKLLCRAHLSIYKNKPEVNQAFMRSVKKNHMDIFNNPVYCKFDEWHGITSIFYEQRLSVYHEEFAADIYPFSNNPKCVIGTNFSNQSFIFNQGRVYQQWEEEGVVNKKELVYIHFQQKNFKINFNLSGAFPESIVFTSEGAHRFNDGSVSDIPVYNTVPSLNFSQYFNRLGGKIAAFFNPDMAIPQNGMAFQ